MWRVNSIFVVAAACFVTASHGASVSEMAQNDQRFLASTIKYNLLTFDLATSTGIQQVANDKDAIDALGLTENQVITFVVHGRASSPDSEFGIVISDALINADPSMAVILVDWTMFTFNDDFAVVGVPAVAEDLSKFIKLMVAAADEDADDESVTGSRKPSLNNIHLIGFDLGAHVVGRVSRDPESRARKITALDPAALGWNSFSPPLRSTDADLVEVIHTDGVGVRAYGIGEPLGDLDFFPNGGTRQPPCAAADNLCHHNHSWQLFAATVQMKGHLIGLRCDSMVQVNNNRCVGSPTAVMGSAVLAKTARGIYRVNTSRTPPYSA